MSRALKGRRINLSWNRTRLSEPASAQAVSPSCLTLADKGTASLAMPLNTVLMNCCMDCMKGRRIGLSWNRTRLSEPASAQAVSPSCLTLADKGPASLARSLNTILMIV